MVGITGNYKTEYNRRRTIHSSWDTLINHDECIERSRVHWLRVKSNDIDVLLPTKSCKRCFMNIHCLLQYDDGQISYYAWKELCSLRSHNYPISLKWMRIFILHFPGICLSIDQAVSSNFPAKSEASERAGAPLDDWTLFTCFIAPLENIYKALSPKFWIGFNRDAMIMSST